MTNLFETESLNPSELFKGDVVYYADAHAVEHKQLHSLQVTKVVSVTGQSVILDNGRKFSIESGTETTRGLAGVLYPYTSLIKAMVTEAQNRLTLLNDVEGINFSALTSQQLSMILDVSRGAFTQVSAPSPCGGGCHDTVEVAGIDIDIPQSEVIAPIAFNDATYELTQDELDDIEDADDKDEEYEDVGSDYIKVQG